MLRTTFVLVCASQWANFFQTAHIPVASGEKGLWVIWHNSVIRFKNKGEKSAFAGFNYKCVRVIIVKLVCHCHLNSS